jgi:aldehyde dehydrogenase (NAD+)
VGNEAKFYIDGSWVDPLESGGAIAVIDPATEQEVARVAAGTVANVDAAVQAAHRAFTGYSRTTREERLILLADFLAAYKRRLPEIAAAMTIEVGIPKTFSERVQARIGEWHLETALKVLATMPLKRIGARPGSSANPSASVR